MKLSTRSRYGVRLMYELAIAVSRKPVILKDIAARQEISEKYLSKLIIPLKGAGMIISTRGAQGGYTLARDPSNITLLQIVRSLEGDITPVQCVNDTEMCSRSLECPVRSVWIGLDKVILDYLESITLEDLVKKAESGDSCAYSI